MRKIASNRDARCGFRSNRPERVGVQRKGSIRPDKRCFGTIIGHLSRAESEVRVAVAHRSGIQAAVAHRNSDPQTIHIETGAFLIVSVIEIPVARIGQMCNAIHKTASRSIDIFISVWSPVWSPEWHFANNPRLTATRPTCSAVKLVTTKRVHLRIQKTTKRLYSVFRLSCGGCTAQ